MHHALIVNHLADSARFGIEQWCLTHNVYGFTDLAEFQLYIDTALLVHLQLESRDGSSPKTGVFHGNGIVSGGKASDSIAASISGSCRMRNIAINIRHDYLSVWNHGTAGIGNQAGNAACADLRQTDAGNQEQHSNTHELRNDSFGVKSV